MAERSVSVVATIADIDPDVAFARLCDLRSYAAHAEEVRDIELGVDADGHQVSTWSVWFRNGLLQWTERDIVDEAARTLTFEQTAGDPARFDGVWRVETQGDRVIVRFEAVVDLGIASLAEMLDPLAVRGVRSNTVGILKGLFGPDIEFGVPATASAGAQSA